MLLAFAWWSVLLFAKNRDAYRAKVELFQMGMVAEGLVSSEEEFLQSEQYLLLKEQYDRQEHMILGETIFLILSLLGGMYIIYQGYQREVASSRQQRNFLLSITHELKSPIASIRLILETLDKRKDSLQAEQINRLSNNGIKESDRLNKLVEDLLLSARLESAYQFQNEELNILELLQPIVNRLRNNHPDAIFSLEAGEDLPQVVGDRQALTSVFVNLLENAVKYSTAPARISVNMIAGSKDELLLSVADEGIGIPDKEKSSIFRKFYRVGNEDTRQTKGTGLGLFIVAAIIEAHGGTIKVENNRPQGSIFRFSLPIVSA